MKLYEFMNAWKDNADVGFYLEIYHTNGKHDKPKLYDKVVALTPCKLTAEDGNNLVTIPIDGFYVSEFYFNYDRLLCVAVYGTDKPKQKGDI